MKELQLSKDLTVITAEIQSYKQMAGQSIFEIGRRLKYVRENDLAHGEWGRWLEKIQMSRGQATKFITVYEELGTNDSTWNKLGTQALYHIATLPEEEREKEHTLDNGETKTVDEMTNRELQEVKRKLREEKQAREQAEQIAKSERTQRERLEQQEPTVKEVIKEVIPDHIEAEKNQLEREIETYKNRLKLIEDENRKLDRDLQNSNLTKEEYEKLKNSIEHLSIKRTNLEQDVEDIDEIIKFITEIDRLTKNELAPISYSKAVRRQAKNSELMDRLNETVLTVEKWCEDMRDLIGVEHQVIEMEAYK